MGCLKGACENRFKSLDGSTPLDTVMEKFNEKRNGGGDRDDKEDVLALKDGLLTPAKMADLRVTSIACENDERLPLANLKCSDSFKDLAKMTNSFEMLARCPDPIECNQGEQAVTPLIIGDNSGFHRDSHICFAAAHAKKLVKTQAG